MRNTEAGDLVRALERSALAMSTHTLEARWSRPALRAAVRGGGVVRLLPELYVAAEHSESLYSRAHALTTWVGGASVLVGAGAASAWGLATDPGRRVDVSAPYGLHRRCPEWARVWRLPSEVPSAEWGRCPVATPAWAAVTAFAHSTQPGRDRLIYLAVQQGLASPAELLDAAGALGRIRGRRRLESVIAATADGAESHLETVGLRTVFSTREFSGFIRQHRLRVESRAFRLDMFHPGTRTAVELDGAEAHGLAVQRARDVHRDATLAAAGILTLRFTYGDLVDRAPWCRQVLRDTLACREQAAKWA